MWQTPGTKTLVPQEICTWLHLSHQHHCSSNCTCTLGPRYCNSSLCLTLGSIVTLTACVPGLVPRRIPSVRAFPMDHKKRRGPQKSSLLRTPVALASTATYRISLVLATEDTGCFCWDCRQLMELQGDYVAVPSRNQRCCTIPHQAGAPEPPEGESLSTLKLVWRDWKTWCSLKCTEINAKPSEMWWLVKVYFWALYFVSFISMSIII